ncbi:MAG: TolC family protein [Bacteroidales bacterium]|nr:TolC family protein [Bacteroidales bacterium]
MAQTKMYLSLDSARHYALEYNKNLINAGYAVDEAEMKLRETIAQGLPQVDGTVDYSNFFGHSAELGPGFVINFPHTSNINLSVGQLIFSGSYIIGIQTAKLFKTMTETSLEKSELEIRALVTQSYYLGLISMRSKEIVAANLQNMKDVLEKTGAMVAAGIMEEVDYDQLRVQANMLENANRAADRQVELAINMLRLQMGLDASADIELTDRLDEIVTRTDFQGTLINALNLSQNIDFKLMELQTSIAGKQVNLQKAAYLPTLTGFYNYTEKLLKPEFDMQPNHLIGMNMSIPIFSSGLRKSRLNQAKINLMVAENQKELLSEQLMIQEKQLRFNLNTALEQYESQKANVEVAQRVFESIRNKFEQGMISSLDLTTANNNYLQAENSYISAVMQLLDAHVAMDKLLNRI